jgi:uncharacterized membrane protein YgcG
MTAMRVCAYRADVVAGPLTESHMPRSAIVAIFAGAFMLATPERALLAQGQLAADSLAAPRPALQTPQLLQQLVAPIALYPDALIAQILAASTYPAQIVEADQWMQVHSSLTGNQLGDSVNAQSWDPSVKALTQFPAVLTNMDRNISWTSSLGDAYVNQQQDVMSAVQVMRQRAQQAGKLQSDSQEQVTTQGSTIVIQPANPNVVYVPAYDPWTIYGAPLAVYPGWVPVPGVFYGGPSFAWGLGIGLGAYAGYGWGWHHWDTDWRRHDVMFDHNRFVSRSPTFFDRREIINGSRPAISPVRFGGSRGVTGTPPGFPLVHPGFPAAHPGLPAAHPGFPAISPGLPETHAGFPGVHAGFGGDHQSPRAFAPPIGAGGIHSGAFSGFGHGGTTAGFSARGQASVGGGFHGGGGGGGGRHR